MTKRFRLDGGEYDVHALSSEGKAILERLNFTQLQLQELINQEALLTKAKNGYIADLKAEIIKGRTGIALGELFSAD